MTSSLRKARAGWLFSAGLMALGVLAVLNLFAFVVWRFGGVQSPVLNVVVEPLLELVALLPPTRLTALHAAAALALVGVALGLLGVLVARRQAARIGLEKQRAQDRLRRVHLYRDDGRREPFIGTGSRERKRA